MDENKGRIGGSFATFLDETGDRAEVESRAIKALIVDQLKVAMAEGKVTKTEMARRMDTPRAQLDRLLDPENEGVTLMTLQRAARAVGRELRLELT
jgi:DNA-binding Xre family transcriptional regulator